MKWFKDGKFVGSGAEKPVEGAAPEEVTSEAPVVADPLQGSNVSLSQGQLLELVRAMGEEMRKPTPEQQVKMDEDARRRVKENESRIAVGKAAQAERENRSRGCNHRMDEGRSEKYSIGQQLCSDGMVHVFCVRCSSDIKTFKPTPDQMSVSVG